ncbi:5-oxoprolinase subunit PxpB [Bacillus sp. 3255]|uniref:5-oxoprolinase subunit PxpB n=1 Tax=Bacillus sp. 3255 TaxID=2817904 RepID=UPI002859BFB5|nr:5-oxoprolinase subunit PxpB [Bacillus sp. 3255]MDR6878476.1 inhibitor of KinA [Bacillus sp. 3255]
MNKLIYECHHVGDAAIALTLGTGIDLSTLDLVQQVSAYLEKHPFDGFMELVTAYTTITIYYDCVAVYRHHTDKEQLRKQENEADELLPYEIVQRHIQACLEGFQPTPQGSSGSGTDVMEIPVCYGGEFGPDLDEVAAYHHVTAETIIQLHTAHIYPVYMIGFAPGFPYLGGLPDGLATPRKPAPRERIPAGSVGIGGAQTGIYPLETPGGWQIIGRTPLALFRPEHEVPSLLRAGDRVRFVPITPEVFHAAAERSGRNGL